MRHQTYRGPKLPSALLGQIGDAKGTGRKGSGRNAPGGRKERRKAERVQKKTQRRQPRVTKTRREPVEEDSEDFEGFEEDDDPSLPLRPQPGRQKLETQQPKSILKRTQKADPETKARGRLSVSPEPRISRGVRDKLAEDDAEIAALEKRLGLKSKKLPKSFEDDGLDFLLEGLDDEAGSGGTGKRRRTEDDEWLASKRRRSGAGQVEAHESNTETEEEESGDEEIFDEDEQSGSEEGDTLDSLNDGKDDHLQPLRIHNLEDDDSFDDFSDDSSEALEEVQPRKVRENPYVAPVSGTSDPPAKYIPPSLRAPSTSDAESMARLRRQCQGLLNRLSEANLLTIMKDVEQLYQQNPRQYVTSTLIELLLGLLCDRTALNDTFLILHAGFIAAIYKVIGADFGAQLVERIVTEFDKFYKSSADGGGKEAANLMSLLSELYNFHVIGSNIVFDYIRLFLEELSEVNTELLLRIIRNSGPQLRSDDPSSLKDIVGLLQKAAAKAGEANLSVRTKFMMETISSLKNNRMKTGVAASAVNTEHTVRMRKTLGTLNTRAVMASEPLRIGLSDVRDSEKKGKWWLVGASWKNPSADQQPQTSETHSQKAENTTDELVNIDSGLPDLLQLAREQRMNTDIRRAIFVTIMSASDYKDAHLRLLKLKLKKSQELEIPRVLIHCAGVEQRYNPYYTLIARRFCSDRRLKMAFQFGLWELFKRMGERTDEDDPEEDEDGEADEMNMRRIVNLARMFGALIADGGSPLDLQTLNFVYLQPKTKTFAEVLLTTVILQSQKRSSREKDTKALLDVFEKVNDVPQMARGLQYFLEKVVKKGDVAGSKSERETVRWGCSQAVDALTTTVASTVVEED
ncbi:suppressor of glycerol defect [Coniosporium tulheliwenetii]|uniref:Suppressor of glycerol defect n=1 Tax=Coniosporium tulheliwenetii TaxID=3383036 RepID=A0ACC2ZN28_9PEZI|nr:suppressor of glycerol defect [Cladosporium sp. JES 115]